METPDVNVVDVVHPSFSALSSRFAVRDRDDVIQRCHAQGRYFATELLARHAAVIPPRAVVLDIGTNVGNNAIFYSRCARAAEVFVFEPNPEARSLLLQNLSLNDDLTINTEYVQFGVGARSGRAAISKRPERNLGATQIGAAADGDIEIIAIDSLPFQRLDFVKIDVEGMEIDVLNGARETLRKKRPMLAVEVSPPNNSAFWKWCEELDYHVIDVMRDYQPFDYLCCPKF